MPRILTPLDRVLDFCKMVVSCQNDTDLFMARVPVPLLEQMESAIKRFENETAILTHDNCRCKAVADVFDNTLYLDYCPMHREAREMIVLIQDFERDGTRLTERARTILKNVKK